MQKCSVASAPTMSAYHFHMGARERARTLAATTMFLAGTVTASDEPTSDRWSSGLARRGIDPQAVENPIAVTPEIRAAAGAIAGGFGGTIEQLKRIQAALFDSSRFSFDYDAATSATAAEAFAARHGNCVAFTNLFIAMARSRGLSVRAGFMTPRGHSERKGDLVVVAAHVVAVYPLHDRFVVFDFYRAHEDPTTTMRLLDDYELAALYLNNRAVDALAAGDYAGAESKLKIVLELFPDFAAAHGNLGVARRRQGDLSGAFDAYRQALALEPRDPAILGNLAALYYGLGRAREAHDALLLADLSRATPFTLLARGDLEAADGHPSTALRFYRKAARLDPHIAEPHASIARVALASGNVADARREALRALKLDPGNREAAEILDEPGP